MRRLLPDPVDPVDPAEVYADRPSAEGRPAVRLNMIESVDGAAVVEGRSGGLGGPADRRLYDLLRSLADVVLVGAGTVRAERYGPTSPPGPAIAVVSRQLDLDWEARLFAEARVRPIVLTCAAAPVDRRARASEVADVVVAGERYVDLSLALLALGERGARHVLAEGGPTLNGQLAAAGLLDELCLTLSPTLVGGGDLRRIVAGVPLPATRGLSLRSACEEDGFLFLRYRPT
jgi:riboflavin biosynthesis pyrimidine reductase